MTSGAEGLVPIGETGIFKGLLRVRLGRYRPVSPQEIESIRSIAARHIDRIVSGHAQTREELNYVDSESHQWTLFDQLVATPHGLARVTKTLKAKQV